MRVEISPSRLVATPGQPQPLVITISNTDDVIGGYALRILGADPSWVKLEESEVSLFPEETGVFTAEVTVPHGMEAGERRIAVQVRELTADESTSVTEVVLKVPEERDVRVRLDPLTQTAGKQARFGLLIDNSGNTTIRSRLTGTDAERKVAFRFDPPEVSLAPGEHAVVDLTARAKRPFVGSPVVRVLEIGMEAPPPEGATPPAPPPPPPEQKLQVGRPAKNPAAPTVPADGAPIANATFVQRAKIGRGPISLLGLLTALTVFAAVITLALSKIVGQSAADRNLALEIAAAQDAAETSGSSSAAGTVRQLTSGAPVPGVTVDIYPADDSTTPLLTESTNNQGAWTLSGLPAGDYKLTFRGAGFVQLWYPQALSADDAETITLEPNSRLAGLDVSLGGVPATISGTVVGEDVSAATLSLVTPPTPGGALEDGGGATVKTVPIGSDGTFELTDVPSPSIYDLVVTKTGYATSTQRIDVSAGEERTGVTITLRKGDGLITGVVSSSSGPLGGVSLTATSGQTKVSTLSLTDDNVGKFTLRSLPSPATFTVIASKPGFASQTLTVTLAKGQKLKGVGLTLGRSAGSLTGKVSLSDGDPVRVNPVGGVKVTITDGEHTVVTASDSSDDIGTWKVGGLAIPGTYTLTFSRSDLAAQTLSVSLDSTGQITPGSGSATVSTAGVEVTLQRANATVHGRVTQPRTVDAEKNRAVGEVMVQLISGTTTYTVTTASVPDEQRGKYRIENVPPGTYTVSLSRGGVKPTSAIIQLVAGQEFEYSPVLAAAAAITGAVRLNNRPVPAGWFVELYRASTYPTDVYRVVQTGAEGKFRFDDIDAPEVYVVQVRATRGGAPRGSKTVQLSASQQLSITVTADP